MNCFVFCNKIIKSNFNKNIQHLQILNLFMMLCIQQLIPVTTSIKQPQHQSISRKIEPMVVVHGGAGNVAISNIPFKIKGVKLAARIGYQSLIKTKNVLDAVEAAVRVMESDEHFNAGYGSVLTWDGDVEDEASIMHGGNLKAGCASIIKDILHPISVARRIMEQTRHNYLAGDGAIKFAREQGFEILPPGSLVTDAARKALEDYKNSLNESNYIMQQTFSGNVEQNEFGEPGTVGAVAIDSFGNIAVATSTGGITGKLQGRIGDTPILGSGTYADNQMGGVSSTGQGEPIMRFNLAHRILDLIKYKSLNAQNATEQALNEMNSRINGSTAGAITIDLNGNVGIYFTSKRMSWAYQKNNQLHYGINPGQDNVEFVTN